VVDAGGVVVEVLQTYAGRPGGQPILADLATWANTYSLPVTAVIDRDPDAETETFAVTGRREQAYVIDLSTMKVVYHFAGSTSGGGPEDAYSVARAIDDVLARLGG